MCTCTGLAMIVLSTGLWIENISSLQCKQLRLLKLTRVCVCVCVYLFPPTQVGIRPAGCPAWSLDRSLCLLSLWSSKSCLLQQRWTCNTFHSVWTPIKRENKVNSTHSVIHVYAQRHFSLRIKFFTKKTTTFHLSAQIFKLYCVLLSVYVTEDLKEISG